MGEREAQIALPWLAIALTTPANVNISKNDPELSATAARSPNAGTRKYAAAEQLRLGCQNNNTVSMTMMFIHFD
jgi:hypothetical protein